MCVCLLEDCNAKNARKVVELTIAPEGPIQLNVGVY